MHKTYFTLVIHNHQPVGNFDHVIEDAYRMAYLPFIEVMEGFPQIPFGMHISGPLWEWLDAHHPEFWSKLVGMVERGQVEIIGGGFYEPILPVLPLRDQLAQIEMMNRKIEERFGKAPLGAWTAERIWEPQMPQPFAQCGIRYTFLDDTHFNMAGIHADDLDGLYLTGHAEHRMTLFPISQQMRYAVPFKNPEEAIAEILAVKSDLHDTLVCLADDGEKFGLWRGTNDNCYRQKWLERFLKLLLDHHDQIETVTPAEAVKRLKPHGKAYLPTASYFEMTEWALPAEASATLVSIREQLEESGELERFRPFLKGGHWRNFLAKYEESSRLYNRMLHVSVRVASLPVDNTDTRLAQRELYRAQCNCAYWHGIFGGLYLPHLRSALWEHLIEADRICDSIAKSKPESELVDIDGDGEPEVRLYGKTMAVTVKPDTGRIDDIEIYRPAINLVDTLSRRPEAYHKLIATAISEAEAESGSIHDAVLVKEPNLENLLVYDRYLRKCAIDHLLHDSDDLPAFESGDTRWNTYPQNRFELAGLKINIPLSGDCSGNQLHYNKSIRIEADEPLLECSYEFGDIPVDPVKRRFGSEWCINLRDGHSDQTYFNIAGLEPENRFMDSRIRLDNVSQIDMVCRWMELRIRLEIEPAALLLIAPLQTVSASESGMERVFQGSMMLFHWDLKPGLRCSIRLRLL